MTTSPDFVIEAKNLSKKFTLGAGFFAKKDKSVYAVNDLSFGIERGKSYGLVGESGCGKTTTARMLVGMYKADSGDVLYKAGADSAPESIFAYKRTELKNYREKIKYVFQDPSRSLNPRMTVFDILTAAFKYSSKWPGKAAARIEAEKIIQEVGLDLKDLERRPSEFSGGQRQRISIARALIMQPDVIFCDEVVSALDVSVQSQILNLLQEIRQKRGISFLFIAHDLRVSCWFCDTIGVMYRGVLLEEAPAGDFYKNSAHPYSQLLFKSSDDFTGESSKSGEMKTALESIHGCPFAHRCPKATAKCRENLPDWKRLSDGHKVRCFLFD